FFALSLSREGDPESGDGSFSVGEYDDRYSDVQHAPLLPQFPAGSGDWSILTDGVFVNGSKIPWGVDPAANIPAGKAKGLLDTGTSLMNLPRDVRDGIYSAVPGAVQTSPNSSLDDALGSTLWIVPCETAIDLQIGFGGELFRIHPLDLSELDVILGPDGNNYTVCVSLIFPGTERDAIFGDLFLHNVYTVFGFGNETTKGAYIQLLSLTNDTSSADYSNIQSPLLANGPPELSPADFSPTSAPSSSQSQSGHVVAGDLAAVANAPVDSEVAKYGPVVIGLLGTNLALLLFLLYLGVSSLLKHGRTAGLPRRTREAKYSPV
ncbi:aspartic peptidase domain-containing protein, partial [Mycena metata]